MRSFFKLPGTVFVAVAALFAVVASTSTANALMLRDTAPVTAAVTGPTSVEKVAVRWWEAFRARRDIARSMRTECRGSDSRSQRHQCYRDARHQMRDMHREARNTYRECRADGGRRSSCRQDAWQYWVDQANGGGSSDGGSEGPLPDPSDLPQ
jgi:hypothetical protein